MIVTKKEKKMILEEIKNIKSGKKELREFGIVVGVVFGFIGGSLWWRHKEHYIYFFILSLFFILSGLLIPIILKPIQKIWMAVGLIIGAVMTRVILCLLFYVVVTPLGLLNKMTSKDSLNLRFNKELQTYWIKRKKESFNKLNYERQF